MKCMKLGDRNVEIAEYPTKEDTNLLYDVLNKYTSGSYNESIRETKKQSMMKRFHDFLCCPKHCKVSDYMLEYKLCGEPGCELCPRKPRVLQMNNEELTREVLNFVPLPRVDSDASTYLPFDECQRLVDNGATLTDELCDLKRVRDDFAKNDDEHVERKKRDSEKTAITNWTKVRMIQKCDECGAPRCFFSRYAPGHAKGPKKKHFDKVRRHIETNGYKCGDLVQMNKNGEMINGSEEDSEREEPILFCREANLCGAVVEAQYYAPKNKKERGSRIITKYVCCHCYADRKLASIKDVEAREERRGRKFNPICKDCLSNGVPVVYTKGAKKNQAQASSEKRKRKDAGRVAHQKR